MSSDIVAERPLVDNILRHGRSANAWHTWLALTCCSCLIPIICCWQGYLVGKLCKCCNINVSPAACTCLAVNWIVVGHNRQDYMWKLALGSRSALYKHSAMWNLIMDYAGRLASPVDEDLCLSKKKKTGGPQSLHQAALLIESSTIVRQPKCTILHFSTLI